jgi:hypothetical protein
LDVLVATEEKNRPISFEMRVKGWLSSWGRFCIEIPGAIYLKCGILAWERNSAAEPSIPKATRVASLARAKCAETF